LARQAPLVVAGRDRAGRGDPAPGARAAPDRIGSDPDRSPSLRRRRRSARLLRAALAPRRRLAAAHRQLRPAAAGARNDGRRDRDRSRAPRRDDDPERTAAERGHRAAGSGSAGEIVAAAEGGLATSLESGYSRAWVMKCVLVRSGHLFVDGAIRHLVRERVLLARDVLQVVSIEAAEQPQRLGVERLEPGVADGILALELTDQQLRIGADLDLPVSELPGMLQAQE